MTIKPVSQMQDTIPQNLGASGHTQMLIAGSLWRRGVAGVEITRHDSGRAILIPIGQLGEEPNRLAHRLNRIIREYQGRK